MSNFQSHLQHALQLFPYKEPNKQQMAIMQKICSLPDNGALLVQAATGVGKTAASLAAMLARREPEQKLIIFVRTVTQMEPILREWSRVVGGYEGLKQGGKPLILPIYGKARYCRQFTVLQKYSSFPESGVSMLCKTLPCMLYPKHPQYFRQTRYNSKYLLTKINFSLAGQGAHGLPSMSKVIEITNQLPDCGYFEAKAMQKHADIVIATYPYLKEPLLSSLLRSMGIEAHQAIVLVDEGHNLINSSQIELAVEQIQYAIDLLGPLGLLKKLMEMTTTSRRVYAKFIAEEGDWEYLLRILTESTPEDRDIMGISMLDLTRPEIVSLVAFIRARSSGFITTSRKGLMIVQATPSEITSNLSRCYLHIYQSGTFNPIDKYKSIYNMPYAETLETHQEQMLQLKGYLAARGLTSMLKRRSPSMFDRMAQTIIELHATNPRHTLVICPSYDFKETLHSYLTNYTTEIVNETRDANQSELTRKIMFSTTSQIITAVSGGKISEGTEVVRNGQSLISMLLMAGLPYSPPSRESVVLQKIWTKAARDQAAAQQFQTNIPILRVVKQAFGRTIRSSSDRGALVILDFRAEKFLAKEMGLQRYGRVETLVKQLSSFYEGYVTLDRI